jgi:spermidine synthase
MIRDPWTAEVCDRLWAIRDIGLNQVNSVGLTMMLRAHEQSKERKHQKYQEPLTFPESLSADCC